MEESNFADNVASFIPFYPSNKDPQFSYDIARKKEFQDIKLPPSEEVPKEQGVPLLSQELQSRFFSPHTDFTSGLLFHGMGVGKCVLPGTVISTSVGDILIEKLFTNAYSIFEFDDGEGFWFKPEFDIYVPSFDGNAFCPRLIKKMYRQNIREMIVIVQLENGSKIRMTQAHKLFNGDEWTNDFEVGRGIAFPTQECMFEKDLIFTDRVWSDINILYSKISSIDIEYYEGYVYDLEIQDTHNYIANNILCHNTCTSSLIVEHFKSTLVNGKPREPAIVIVPNAKIARSYRAEVMSRCTREGIYIPEKTSTELRKEKMVGPLEMTEMTLERRLKAAVEKTYRIFTLETFFLRSKA